MLPNRFTLRRAAAHWLAALVLVGSAAAAGATRMVHENGWAVTAPRDWDPAQGNAAFGADFRMFALGGQDAACAFSSRPGLGLGMTNAEMKSSLAAGALSSAAIGNYIEALLPGELSDTAFAAPSVQKNHPSGWPFHRVSFAYYDGGPRNKGGNASEGWAIITFRNDTVFVGYCGAGVATAPRAAGDVNAIFNSIEFTR